MSQSSNPEIATGRAPRLMAIFSRLHHHFGDLDWWPAETPFEVAIGAILTQNTAWHNVKLALDNLRAAAALTPAALQRLSSAELETLIRPAGFFRQKAACLQRFSQYLCDRHGERIEPLLVGELDEVRSQLLGFKGIGPETADSILLYAGEQPSFVVDAYTRRLLTRLGLIRGTENYETIRALFMVRLEKNVALYNEFHALIVAQCKQFCRKRNPDCGTCPLRKCCPRTGIA